MCIADTSRNFSLQTPRSLPGDKQVRLKVVITPDLTGGRLRAAYPFIAARGSPWNAFTESATSGGRGGAGLVHAITERIIERHGSDIKVDSVVDVGTTFTFTLSGYQPEA